MSYLYHGSSITNLKILNPRKSTYGTFVYATSEKELAVIFSARCFDDQTLSIVKDNDKWTLVERIPNGFEVMFDNPSSIYTVDSKTFKDINTGFSELVSNKPVNIIKEEKISNVYNMIKDMVDSDLINIYKYPSRPKVIPDNDIDLLNKEIDQKIRNNKEVDRHTFDRLLYLHPNLLEDVNKELEKRHLKLYKEDELIDIYEYHVIGKLVNPSHEEYLESAYISISKLYPKLISTLDNKLSILNKSKKEQLFYLIGNNKNLKEKYDYIMDKIPNMKLGM